VIDLQRFMLGGRDKDDESRNLRAAGALLAA